MFELPTAMLMSPGHTARPVDARWRRIVDLADRRKRATYRYDDGWIKVGLLYLNRLRRCRTDADRARLARSMPGVDDAYKLHQADKVTRGIVEARLLAGQGVQEVAAACGMTPEAVGVYEKLFFQVFGRLGAWFFVLNRAMGVNLWDGSLTEDDADVFLKLFAFQKGPIFLEAMIGYFRHGLRVPERLEEATAEQLEELANALMTKALVRVRVLPFPRCMISWRLMALSRELRRYARTLAGEVDQGPNTWQAELPFVTEDVKPVPSYEPRGDAETWWSAWKAAVLAA